MLTPTLISTAFSTATAENVESPDSPPPARSCSDGWAPPSTRPLAFDSHAAMRGSGRASVVPVPACPRARRANRPGPLLRSMREKRAVMCNTNGAQRHLLNPPVHPWAWLPCTAETEHLRSVSPNGTFKRHSQTACALEPESDPANQTGGRWLFETTPGDDGQWEAHSSNRGSVRKHRINCNDADPLRSYQRATNLEHARAKHYGYTKRKDGSGPGRSAASSSVMPSHIVVRGARPC